MKDFATHIKTLKNMSGRTKLMICVIYILEADIIESLEAYLASALSG
jgi:hypothetical protein